VTKLATHSPRWRTVHPWACGRRASRGCRGGARLNLETDSVGRTQGGIHTPGNQWRLRDLCGLGGVGTNAPLAAAELSELSSLAGVIVLPEWSLEGRSKCRYASRKEAAWVSD